MFTILKTNLKRHKKTEFTCGINAKNQIKLNNTSIVLRNNLKDDNIFKIFNYNQLIFTDVTAIDHLERTYRFSVLYTFLNFKTKVYTFLDLNTKFILNPTTYTAAYTYFASIAAEREIYDLFGIFFINHPDLRRILTDYSFIGHPLRKDYSLIGSKELIYSVIKKIIKVNPIFLSQEFRNMEYNLVWVELE